MVEEILIQNLIKIVKEYPWAVSAMLVMSCLRIVNKPMFQVFQDYVRSTETKADDRILKSLERNRLFIIFCFFLDLIASIKLISPANPSPTKDPNGSKEP